jgi:Phage terminase large subunit (GpA)
MDKETRKHIESLRQTAFDTYDLKDAAQFIMNKTFLNGERFSFKHHEYQQDILADTSKTIVVQKSSQIGMTEIQVRWALALCGMIKNFTAICVWPYRGDASGMMRTRISPIINNSPYLSAMVDKGVDNTELKEFNNGSWLYARGCNSDTAALSVPGSVVIGDEIDRCDPHVLAQFQSRLKHSPWALTRLFGTPTVAGVGVHKAMQATRRKVHMCKCEFCNHSFVPTYDDVHIPGYSHSKREITKDTIGNIRWKEAVVLCPSCFKAPSLLPKHRQWVVENDRDSFEAVGYHVTPFSVPVVMTPAKLVMESTRYNSYSEFENQGLGLASDSADDQLSPTDLATSKFDGDLNSTEMHYLGADMGLTCHLMVGRITLEGVLLVVHRVRVPLRDFEAKFQELSRRYKVLIAVCDAFPYTDLILRMQRYYSRCYGGVYHGSRGMATYQIKLVKEDKSEGKLPINQAMIHRNLNFDEVMALFKQGKILWQAQDEKEDAIFVQHLLDMKRKQEFDRNNEMAYSWTKSAEGQDHYHHTLGYLHVAARLAETYRKDVPLIGVPIVKKFRVTS